MLWEFNLEDLVHVTVCRGRNSISKAFTLPDRLHLISAPINSVLYLGKSAVMFRNEN
jgi:hypothetical protein